MRKICLTAICILLLISLTCGCKQKSATEVFFEIENGTVRLWLPESWEYEINETGNEEIHEMFSVNIKPRKEEGYLKFIFCYNSFLLTNVRFPNGDEESIEGKTCVKHVEENEGFWDFVEFKGYTGCYLVYAKNIKWASEYEDEINNILEKSVFGENVINAEKAIEIAKTVHITNNGKILDSVTAKFDYLENYWQVEFVDLATNDRGFETSRSYYFIDVYGNYLYGGIFSHGF